ncbi:ZIP Zinc transporter, putative [Talaromyces stipitatus ATCC 10500]|uniref:ZIP Zinc transporter, putative n=1 Tax=Talaromyces stipitatus (strain ATCC 10500 / CBS 375.48 / QM 6759 / NRRL 1006) TaxID=441959 RepID=B8M5B9_TALSN|nr:ZIP Zinc transporter, putative [Talaromyces stipitatus ATCC 10500]EED19725.1 ZIP Zinc transporter, putative [Talaromyces stipitatus ATCC 10500]
MAQKMSQFAWRTCVICVLVVFFLSSAVSAKSHVSDKKSIASYDAAQIEEELQHCPLVQALNEHKLASLPETASWTSKIFAVLFPGSPAVNALLATLYISGPPNFLLALCPPNIDPSSLSIMVAFAVGGLLGDTLFHLLPEIFLGEDSPEHARFVLVENNKNLLLGLGIMVGFLTFVAMDKTLRIATGGEGGHDHTHSHDSHDTAVTTGSSPGKGDKNGEVKKRKGKGVKHKDGDEKKEEINPSTKLGGYLNLIADFTHNITDGLALSSSFYASPTIGATTTVAVFFHEIPHEVGDFALLIQSGFSKNKAMGAQFVTAIGAFLGTFIGIAVQEFGGNTFTSSASSEVSRGLLGTGLSWGDMLLPFTAGTFLYVGTVAVIPELLETGKDKGVEIKKTLSQFAAIAAGAGIMLWISWS